MEAKYRGEPSLFENKGPRILLSVVHDSGVYQLADGLRFKLQLLNTKLERFLRVKHSQISISLFLQSNGQQAVRLQNRFREVMEQPIQRSLIHDHCIDP